MNTYPAKILLFGEYSLMHGSHALAAPFWNFSGRWSQSTEKSGFTADLLMYASYLEKKQQSFPFNIDLQKFSDDIEAGFYFDSSIPMGYGIGSSGALCAAVYEKYVVNGISSNCSDNLLAELKMHLSLLESYFHGFSSGIDPLISYTKSVILVESKGIVKRILLDDTLDQVTVFLIDSEKRGNTSGNIKIFNDLIKEEYYMQDLKMNYNPLVNRCISSFLEENSCDFLLLMNKLSRKQQYIFESMIPSEFIKYFQLAKKSGLFSLKLCGSGSGGFLLGFTSNFEHVDCLISNNDAKLIPVHFGEVLK